MSVNVMIVVGIIQFTAGMVGLMVLAWNLVNGFHDKKLYKRDYELAIVLTSSGIAGLVSLAVGLLLKSSHNEIVLSLEMILKTCKFLYTT